MAAADYYLCDICDSKTFYDAELPYGEWDDMQENPETHHPWPDGNVGGMVVICKKCAETHKIVITEK